MTVAGAAALARMIGEIRELNEQVEALRAELERRDAECVCGSSRP